MSEYDLTPEYDALYDDNQDLFDDEEYAKLKKSGRLPQGAETKISPEAIVKALENLDYEGVDKDDARARLKNKSWYGNGLESDAVKKSKYGDLPEKMPDEPGIPEDEPLEMGEMWDPKVSDADRAKDKEYAKRMYGEGDNDPENIDELFGDTEKKPDVSITKTTVSKPEHKTNKHSGEKPKAPTSMSKEKVELSADTLRPKEKKSSLWDDEGEDIKFEGPEEKGKKDFQGKLEKDYKGVPFHEQGIEESSDPFGIFAPAEHVSPTDFLKNTAETALLGAAGSRVLKGAGKYAGSKLGKLFGKAEGRGPRIDLTPGEKVPSMSEVGPGNIWDSNAKMAKGHGDDLMFRGVEGADASHTKFGSSKGVSGRRLNLTEKGTGAKANRSDPFDVVVDRKEVPGKRAATYRNTGDFGRTSITQSDMKRSTQQLTDALTKGLLTPEKYRNILKGLGRTDAEIASEIARAFRK